GRRIPAAYHDFHPGTAAEQVQHPRLETSLRAVPEPLLQSLVDELEPALAQRHKNELEEHAPDVIFEALSLGDRQHLLELRASVLEIRARADDGETREGADPRLRAAQAPCELEGS